jgi:chromosome segregation ATPase
LKKSQDEIYELNARLAQCNDELVSAQCERSQLLNQVTGKQELLKKKQEENDELKTKLADCEENFAGLQSECSQLKKANEVADCVQNRYEEEAKTYCDDIELLKKQLKAADVKSKQELKSEVDRLKSEFNEVIQAFEAELVDTCESNANALREKSDEIDALKKKLSESNESISLLETQILELTNKNREVIQQLDQKMALEIDLENVRMQLDDARSAESALSELKHEYVSLVESHDALKQQTHDVSKALKEAEMSKHELKSKLHETLLSIEENMKAYNSLRAGHNTLQQECQVLRDDSSSLHVLVSNLTSEKEQLMNKIDKQAEQYQMLCTVKSSLEQELEKSKSHQSSLEHLLSKVRDEKENLLVELEANKENIWSMKKEMSSMASEISSKQQQIDSLQEQTKTANRHLDEMVTYCDKLKSEFAGTSSALRNELEEQAESMKGIINSLKNQLHLTESEKEENRKIYEKDIELQQTVSLRCCAACSVLFAFLFSNSLPLFLLHFRRLKLLRGKIQRLSMT